MKKFLLINSFALMLISNIFTITYAFEVSPLIQEECNTISPAYTNINQYHARLTISDNVATSHVDVSVSASKSASIKMTLQKKSDEKWIDIKTWNKSGTGSVVLSKTYNVTSGKKYRIKYIITSGNDICSGTTTVKTA